MDAKLQQYVAREEWLQHPSLLHGVDHMARVVQLQEVIADAVELTGKNLDRQALRWAAGLHDVGRIDDGSDPYHGQRGAEWVKRTMVRTIPPNIIDTVIDLVRWHNVSDSRIPSMTTELMILKDADALDRVRMDDLDTSYLRLAESHHCIDIAYSMIRS